MIEKHIRLQNGLPYCICNLIKLKPASRATADPSIIKNIHFMCTRFSYTNRTGARRRTRAWINSRSTWIAVCMRVTAPHRICFSPSGHSPTPVGPAESIEAFVCALVCAFVRSFVGLRLVGMDWLICVPQPRACCTARGLALIAVLVPPGSTNRMHARARASFICRFECETLGTRVRACVFVCHPVRLTISWRPGMAI